MPIASDHRVVHHLQSDRAAQVLLQRAGTATLLGRCTWLGELHTCDPGRHATEPPRHPLRSTRRVQTARRKGAQGWRASLWCTRGIGLRQQMTSASDGTSTRSLGGGRSVAGTERRKAHRGQGCWGLGGWEERPSGGECRVVVGGGGGMMAHVERSDDRLCAGGGCGHAAKRVSRA